MRLLILLLFTISSALAAEPRIGIYTGSFDPPHLGHRNVVIGMKEKFNLDAVYVIPDMNTTYKKLSEYSLRAKMVETLFRNDSGVSVIPKVLNGPTFELWDFPAQIEKITPGAKFFSIVGTDTMNWLATQPLSDAFKKVTLLVNERSGVPSGATPKGMEVLSADLGDAGFSSSAIRKALAEGSQPDALSKGVYRFILKNGMYGSCGGLMKELPAASP